MSSIRCNVCGKQFKDDGRYLEFHNAQLHKFVIKGAYGSSFDLNEITFYECDDCIRERFDEFLLLPQVTEYEF